MQIKRFYTESGKDPLSSFKFEKRTSEIRNPDGSIVFRMEDIVVPSQWSQVATDIIAQKYFRKAGVPKLLKRIREKGVPSWLQSSRADVEKLELLPEKERYYSDHKTGELTASSDAYTHPQPHACFIQSVSDDLVNEGGIMDLWVREARLFKYGSGTGTNFSGLRGNGEPVSGGGGFRGVVG